MKKLKHFMIIGVFFVLVTGTLAHFLYEWTGNNFIVGLFTPINESVWEHMKLIFFPMLLYSIAAILKLRKDYPCITSAFCFGILTGTILIPVFFYTYTGILGRNIFPLDIGTFILSTIIAFFAAYKLTLSCKVRSYAILLCGLTVIFLHVLWYLLIMLLTSELVIYSFA